MRSRKVGPVLVGAGSAWIVVVTVIAAALLRPGLASFPDFARGTTLDYGIHAGRTYAPLSERFIEDALGVGAPSVARVSSSDRGAGGVPRQPGRALNAIGPGHEELTWQGREFRESNSAGPDACSTGAGTSPCDHFFFTVDVGREYWAANEGGVRVSISFDLKLVTGAGLATYNDFDLYVYRDGSRVASSVTRQHSTNEEVFLAEATGRYEVRVVPEAVFAGGGRYVGNAQLVSRPRSAARNQAYHAVRVRGGPPSVEPQTVPVPYTGEPVSVQAVDVGNVNNPSIGVDSSGTAFALTYAPDGGYTPLPGEPRQHLLRSTDGGLTWTDTAARFGIIDVEYPRKSPHPDMMVDGPTGRIFWADGFAYDGMQVSFSDDKGETFESAVAYGQERPWMLTAPVPKGVALTTLDPAFDRLVYQCATDFQYTHLGCSRSIDGGRSFVPIEGTPFLGWNVEKAAECRTYAGAGTADRDGRLFIPRNYCDRWDPRDDLRWIESNLAGEYDNSWGQNEIPTVAISENAGTTWDRVVVNDGIRSVHNAVPQMAADSDGNLYFVWEDLRHHLPYMATSTDHGRTWSDPVMIAPPGVHEASFTKVVAGDRGRVAFVFIGTTTRNGGDLTRPWNLYVGVSENALSEAPLFVSTTVNDTADPVHRGNCEMSCSWISYGLDIEMSPFDGSFWAVGIDTCTNLNRCRTHPAPGHTDEHGPGVASDDRGIAVRQLSGPSLWARGN